MRGLHYRVNFQNIMFLNQGPVVQSIVSLTSPVVVNLLIVLVSTIQNSQVFLLKIVRSFRKCKSFRSNPNLCNDLHHVVMIVMLQ